MPYAGYIHTVATRAGLRLISLCVQMILDETVFLQCMVINGRIVMGFDIHSQIANGRIVTGFDIHSDGMHDHSVFELNALRSCSLLVRSLSFTMIRSALHAWAKYRY